MGAIKRDLSGLCIKTVDAIGQISVMTYISHFKAQTRTILYYAKLRQTRDGQTDNLAKA